LCLTRQAGGGIRMAMLVYKIFRAGEWAELCDTGSTVGAAVDRQDGFVHLSTGAQVAETVAKHFADETGLAILALETDDLGDALKWEPSRGGDLFPHLYRVLEIDDILWQTDLPLGPEGHEFPDGVLPE